MFVVVAVVVAVVAVAVGVAVVVVDVVVVIVAVVVDVVVVVVVGDLLIFPWESSLRIPSNSLEPVWQGNGKRERVNE